MASRSRGWSSTRQLEIANCCARLGRRGRRLPLASSLSIRDLIPASLRTLPRDGVLLFVSRFTRLFAYGALSVILVFYLVSLGLSEAQVGVLLTLTLAGDMAISLLLTTQADRIGRRRIRNNQNSSLLDRRGDHRPDQRGRSPSRAVPFDRTSRPGPRGSCPQPHGSIRVVHAG